MFFSLINVVIIKTQCPTHKAMPYSFLDIDTPLQSSR